MSDFARPRSVSRFLFPAMVVAVGWFAWTQVFADAGEAKDDEARTVTIDGEEIRGVLRDELKRHDSALEKLEAARDALKTAKADSQAIDRLIETEKQEHNARVKRLNSWLDAKSARKKDDARRTRSIVNSELRDIARAIGSLNQSYRIAPISRPGAETGGSKFVDYQDRVDKKKQARKKSPDDEKSVPESESSESSADTDPRKPLGEALLREVPREQAENPTTETSSEGGSELGGKDQSVELQRRLDQLTKQLAAIQQQLTQIRSEQK